MYEVMDEAVWKQKTLADRKWDARVSDPSSRRSPARCFSCGSVFARYGS
jgi:hypothetical protein